MQPLRPQARARGRRVPARRRERGGRRGRQRKRRVAARAVGRENCEGAVAEAAAPVKTRPRFSVRPRCAGAARRGSAARPARAEATCALSRSLARSLARARARALEERAQTAARSAAAFAHCARLLPVGSSAPPEGGRETGTKARAGHIRTVSSPPFRVARAHARVEAGATRSLARSLASRASLSSLSLALTRGPQGGEHGRPACRLSEAAARDRGEAAVGASARHGAAGRGARGRAGIAGLLALWVASDHAPIISAGRSAEGGGGRAR